MGQIDTLKIIPIQLEYLISYKCIKKPLKKLLKNVNLNQFMQYCNV